MKKFEGWRTEELQYVASLIAGRDMQAMVNEQDELYNQVIREIRNRRVKEELGQLTLGGPYKASLKGLEVKLDDCSE